MGAGQAQNPYGAMAGQPGVGMGQFGTGLGVESGGLGKSLTQGPAGGALSIAPMALQLSGLGATPLGGALTGATSGALSGAQMGAMFGPAGAVPGAITGGILGLAGGGKGGQQQRPGPAVPVSPIPSVEQLYGY